MDLIQQAHNEIPLHFFMAGFMLGMFMAAVIIKISHRDIDEYGRGHMDGYWLRRKDEKRWRDDEIISLLGESEK